MLFSSVIFIWHFLPAVLVSYLAVGLIFNNNPAKKRNAQNIVLLISSLVFYGFGGFAYLLLMGAVLFVNYFGAFSLVGKGSKGRFIMLIFANLFILFCFKYLNLFVLVSENISYGIEHKEWRYAIRNIVTLTRTGTLSWVDIVLPLGISFYIFQSISYISDVYRGKAKLQESFLKFALYISFFPQLVAGPIVQYSEIEDQLDNRESSVGLFASGVESFVYGLAKKVLIANTVAKVADEIWALKIDGLGASITWLALICYTMQIYFDFSGYSDMAIGLGRMFGFRFKRNFDYPYISTSIQDFWRRWHISLSSWFRDYVYIPLGGSRCSQIKHIRNLLVVFLLTGIWHGANFTFVVWGLMYAILLVIEKLFLGKILKANPVKIINRIYSMAFVMLGWVFFRSDNILQAFRFVKELFSRGTGDYNILSFLSTKVILALLFGFIFMTPVYPLVRKKISNLRIKWLFRGIETLVQIILFMISMVMIVSSTYNPFIYFQF